MGQRLQLQTILELILGIPENVYFQPPSKHAINYPCIIYNRNTIQTTHADNSAYRLLRRYSLTVISLDPDNEFVEKIAKLPMCTHDRFFVADNLNHDVFSLYF